MFYVFIIVFILIRNIMSKRKTLFDVPLQIMFITVTFFISFFTVILFSILFMERNTLEVAPVFKSLGFEVLVIIVLTFVFYITDKCSVLSNYIKHYGIQVITVLLVAIPFCMITVFSIQYELIDFNVLYLYIFVIISKNSLSKRYE